MVIPIEDWLRYQGDIRRLLVVADNCGSAATATVVVVQGWRTLG